MKYGIEIWKDGNAILTKTSENIWELKEWIREKYPKAYRLPVLPAEMFCKWYVCKYGTEYAGKKTAEDNVTIYIKKLINEENVL